MDSAIYLLKKLGSCCWKDLGAPYDTTSVLTEFEVIVSLRYVELLTKHKTEKLVWEETVAEHSFSFRYVQLQHYG